MWGKKKKRNRKNPEGCTEAKLQSHSFPAASCECTFLNCGAAELHLTSATSTAWPPRVYSGWERNPPLKGAQDGEQVEGTQPGHGMVTVAPGPGQAQPLAVLRHLLPFQAQLPSQHRWDSPGAAAPHGAPSPATNLLQLSGSTGAHQRVSDKLERRLKKKKNRATAGNQPLCSSLWL